MREVRRRDEPRLVSKDLPANSRLVPGNRVTIVQLP